MPLRDMPIRKKLMTVILLTSGVVLFLTCAAFLTYEIVTLRRGLVAGYTTRAEIIAANSTAALAFQNEADADDVLGAMKTDQRIEEACLYDAKGKVFARYPSGAAPGSFPPNPGVSGYRKGHLEIFCPVVQGGRTLGTVYLQSNLSALTDRYGAYAWLATAIIAGSFLVAYLLSRMLQRQISHPVLALAGTAQAISSHRDFSVRAQKSGDDEIGRLTDAFNQMLAEIQAQDQAIKKLNAGLEQRITERTAELESKAREVEEANRRLRELDKEKTDFFSNISHELRTPLTLILAPLETLLAAPGTSPSQRTTLQMVHNNAVRLLQMVNGLLDFSKVSANKTQVNREPVRIEELTRSIFSDFQAVMAQKGIEGDFSAATPSPTVEMDRYLYERILFNLLSNAVKFTARGGKVSLALESGDGRVTVSVRDTGIGISAEDQKVLFEKFRQVESSASRRFEGTGLGLALAREFALLLDGKVTVESRPGAGSTFTFSCAAPPPGPEAVFREAPERRPPALNLAEGDRLSDSTPEPEGSDRPKVLVAEDNPEMAAFIAALLSKTCRVRTVSDGADALEMVRRWRPDLVLSDVMMPRVDGIALTRAVKSDKETSSIPMVLLTALTNRESLLLGWEAGADDYLFKPFHPVELEARVKAILASLDWRRKGEAYRRQRDALEHFTHIASHDLREPLRKIVSFTQLFQSRERDLDPESKGYLRSISDGATRMYRLLDVLMEYSRLDRDINHFVTEDLNEVLGSVVEGLKEEIAGAGAEVTAGPLPKLPVIGGQVSLVFQNLIGNGLKYRKDGRAPRIRVDAVLRDYEWVFSVADNGIGFDPGQSEKIFIMFERLHGTEKYPGDGMGLAICRKIIEKHGGKIWAESKPGEGSTFYFSLPLDRGKAVPVPAGKAV